MLADRVKQGARFSVDEAVRIAHQIAAKHDWKMAKAWLLRELTTDRNRSVL
jgi:hypothetical protein